MRSPSRRTALRLMLAVLRPVSIGWSRAKSNFWDEKEPSEWSDAERNRLLTNSPWAKRVEASMPTRNPGGSGKGGGGGRGGGGGGGGGGRGGGSGGGGEDQGPPPSINVTVRWESAEPIRLANRNTSEKKTDAYLISVSGFPANRSPNRGTGPYAREFQTGPNPTDLATRLQQGAKLEVKGQSTLHPEKVERLAADPQALLFYFERAELPITAAAKEIVFTLKIGAAEVVAKFYTKEMLYKSTLSY